ncbi:MAG: GNAT family N-acetyltransferase [Flavobacterium sp.]|nr:MAG: GNAT family N-acetyltransferase [Flavobacterium sp.]
MKIRIAELKDLEKIIQIYSKCKIELDNQGIFQWTDNYPNSKIIMTDIHKGILYLLEYKNEIIGTINISKEQEKEYGKIEWKFNEGKILVIHRLAIDPKEQGNGFARKLMDFAEDYAEKKGYTSIRLDAFSQNERVIKFYKKRNYFLRGKVNFPEREYPFYCMEKEIKTLANKVYKQ